MDSTLPPREEFVAFWSRKRNPLYSLLKLALYFAVLLSFYAIPPSALSPSQSVMVVIAAFLFAIGVPLLGCLYFWTRNDRFLRCPHCRVWVGRDLLGNPDKKNPDWQRIAMTSRCVRCGERMIRDQEEVHAAVHQTETGKVCLDERGETPLE